MDRLHEATVAVKGHHNRGWGVWSRDHGDIRITDNLIDNCTQAVPSVGKIYDSHGYSMIQDQHQGK